MRIETFSKEHIKEANLLVMENYAEERSFLPILPEHPFFPELEYFAENGLGAAALEGDKMVGFLGVWSPWEGAFDLENGLGTFSPLHAHGSVRENRRRIYQDMVAYAAEKWADEKIRAVGFSLYAHDEEAKKAMFEYGFGMRCKDRIRLLGEAIPLKNTDLTFEELMVRDFPKIRDMRAALNQHLTESPCFMQSTEEDFNAWLRRVEAGDRRTFVAKKNNEFVAYLDLGEEGENFLTYHPQMKNLQGAYCKPQYRGQGIMDDLLNYVCETLKAEGNLYLGVDHESYNPTADRFWAKYFPEYTNSVVRKIELWSREKQK